MRLATELALWLVCRLVALATLALPYGYYVPSDLTVFAEWADRLAGGQTISGDLWQYPAGVALLLGVVGEVGGGTATLVGVILVADLAVLVLLRRTRGAVLWAVSPLFVGPIMLTRLESVVTLTAVAGLLARSPAVSGIWLGLGASLKAWPGVLVAVVRRGVGIRLAFGIAAFAAATLAAVAAFDAPAFLANQRSRGLQVESLAAWPFMAARALGAPVEIVYRNGSTEVAGPVADLTAALLLPIAGILVAGFVVWAWRRTPAGVAGAASHALVIVLLLLLTSRVLSPQFIVWALGLCALMLTRRAVPRALVGCLLGSAWCAQLLYPHVYLDFLDGGMLGLAVQTTRLVLLVAATWLALQDAVTGSAWRGPVPRDRQLRKAVAARAMTA